MGLESFRQFVAHQVTPPQDVVKTELEAWRKYEHSRRDKLGSRVFEPVSTRGDLADLIYAKLYHQPDTSPLKAGDTLPPYSRKAGLTGQDVEGVISRALAQYENWLKAIQATRLDFEGEFVDVLAEGQAQNISTDRFRRLLRALIRKYGIRAFDDGLTRHGVDPDEKSAEDMQKINELILGQTGYIRDFVARLRDGGVINDGDARAAMWFNKSIMPFYQAGEASADKNGLYEWVMGRTIEHCKTCLAANGQRHRLRHWHTAGILPQSTGHKELECGGFNCDCKLVRVQGKARGRLNRIPTA